ncbi:hypothetical protein IAT38_003250 [Cryptococcus sp. DSM 104549]
MMLDTSFTPFPSLEPTTLYSFYPYPVSPRTELHDILPPPTPASAGPGPSTLQHQTQSLSLRSSGRISETRKEDVRLATRRAEKRALMGRLPAGVALGREEDLLDQEDDVLEHEQRDINMFGHRFLLPYGRRLTQMEMDSAPSPSPSEPDHELRQEDNTVGHIPLENGQEAEEDEGEIRDLDASIEDMDEEYEGSDDEMDEDDEEV